MARGRTISTLARRFTAHVGDGAPQGSRSPEDVLVEEPLEIRLGEEVVATTMRTPGHDFELAVGFLHAEGLISVTPAHVRHGAARTVADSEFSAADSESSAANTETNVVTVEPDGSDKALGGEAGRTVRPRLGLVSSSCGICGAEQIDELLRRLEPLERTPGLTAGHLFAADLAVAGSQELFELTGGSHAAAAVDLTGVRRGLAEDIGRHNAVDKLVGSLLAARSLPAPGDPERALVLWVSGRASLEMVQKAWAAGFSALVAVGAASSLAIETAERAGLVLGAFARTDRVTIYACGDRLASAEAGEP